MKPWLTALTSGATGFVLGTVAGGMLGVAKPRFREEAKLISVTNATEAVDLEMKFLNGYTRADGKYAELYGFVRPGTMDVDAFLSICPETGGCEITRMARHELNIYLNGALKATFPEITEIDVVSLGYTSFYYK